MLREKFVTKRQFEVFSRNLDRKLASLKVPSFTVPDDNYDPDEVPGTVPTGGVDYQVLYTDAAGAAQWAMPGDRNVFIGEDAALNVVVADSDDNIFIGYMAGFGSTTLGEEFDGNYNVIIGSYENSVCDTQLRGDCSGNVFIGRQAGWGAYESSGNVVIGDYIGLYSAGDFSLTNCVLLGASIATDIGIMNQTNMIAIGYGAVVDTDNTCRIGNDDLTLIWTQADIRTYGVYYVGVDQVVGARVIDADFANTPDTSDPDTDDLIAAIVSALISHGLVASA